jgi:hypothetical protein
MMLPGKMVKIKGGMLAREIAFEPGQISNDQPL